MGNISFSKASLKCIANIFENIKNNIQGNKLSVASIRELDSVLGQRNGHQNSEKWMNQRIFMKKKSIQQINLLNVLNQGNTVINSVTNMQRLQTSLEIKKN